MIPVVILMDGVSHTIYDSSVGFACHGHDALLQSCSVAQALQDLDRSFIQANALIAWTTDQKHVSTKIAGVSIRQRRLQLQLR